ncbi:MAG TPA: hypothetical protein VGJ73_12485, partial [Verrucomicrobiae bacterium]
MKNFEHQTSNAQHRTYGSRSFLRRSMLGVRCSMFLILTITALSSLADEPPYKNPALSVNTRVADLLGRMTLEEKVRQLDLYNAKKAFLTTNDQLNGTQVKPGTLFVPERAEK